MIMKQLVVFIVVEVAWAIKNFPNVHICPNCKKDKNKSLHSFNQINRKEKVKRVLKNK